MDHLKTAFWNNDIVSHAKDARTTRTAFFLGSEVDENGHVVGYVPFTHAVDNSDAPAIAAEQERFAIVTARMKDNLWPISYGTLLREELKTPNDMTLFAAGVFADHAKGDKYNPN